MDDEKKQYQLIPVQYAPCTEEDEIDLKELVKTIMRHKFFIFIFTVVVTLIATIYIYTSTPLYEIKADIELGYLYLPVDGNLQKMFLNNQVVSTVYIKNTYDYSKTKLKYPEVSANVVKGSKNLINIDIYDTSNQKALNDLQEILNDLKNIEKLKVSNLMKSIKSQINILESQQNKLKNQIKAFNKKLSNLKDPIMYQATLTYLGTLDDKILNIELKISGLKQEITLNSVSFSHVIGKILKSKDPAKPKKKLIIIVAFITGFILSLFLVFFIEFIRTFREGE